VRQRLRTRRSPLVFVSRALVVLVALALIWGGVAIALLALGVGEDAVESVTFYRTAFDFLAELEPADFDGTTRAILAGAGAAALVVFGYLALRELPRPYLARRDLELSQGERGTVTVEPRALERIAESSAEQQPGVAHASGRYGTDELAVGVAVRRAGETADTLSGVRDALRDALDRHGLPEMPVSVVLTGYEPKTRRELN